MKIAAVMPITGRGSRIRRFELEQHHCSEDECDDPAEAENHGRVEDFDDQKRGPQQDQAETRIVDGQHVERIKPNSRQIVPITPARPHRARKVRRSGRRCRPA